ncbi:MAG: OmpA family protein [Arenibacter latericius]|nr:OmpA family protein [Arenibacter latericius]
MNRKILGLWCLLLFLLNSSLVISQNRQIKKADIEYHSYGFLNALDVYLQVANRGYESQELFTKIANSYYFTAKYEEALIWYEKIFNIDDYTPNPETFLRYAQCLRATGKIEKAKDFYNRFVDFSGKSLEGKKLAAKDYLDLIEKNSNRYEIEYLEGLNTEDTEFGRSLHDGKLFFSSNRAVRGGLIKRKSAWDGMNFLDLYMVDINEEYEIAGEPKLVPGEINEKFHESSAVITRDGKTMYFTRNNFTPNKKEKDEQLKIYRAYLIDGKWTNIEDLPINDDMYSTAHPALDAKESNLYFSSDRPGGFGQSDIYVAPINEDGQIGKARNLGPEINTAGKETFPFVSLDNELYFSSDGHFGLGGMDVFYAKITDNGFGNLLNVGKPINSYADDFAFGIDTKTKRGFVSSNRQPEGIMVKDDVNEKNIELKQFVNDNIYRFRELKSIDNLFKAKIHGCVNDIDNQQPIVNAKIEVYKEDGSVFDKVFTNELGCYEVVTNFYSVYRLRATYEDYDANEKVSIAERKEQTLNFELQQNRLELTPGIDIANTLNIKNIFFDFDKSSISETAKVQLEKLVVVLENHPSLKIKIQSHTDSRGSELYNLELSKRRAASTKAYLVERGIDANRLSAEGLGESQLTNHCSDNVPCSEEEHLQNRRSQFIVAE